MTVSAEHDSKDDVAS